MATYNAANLHFIKGVDDVLEDGTLIINERDRKGSKFPEFLPTWNPNDKNEPLKFFKHEDVGSRADPSFPNLFPKHQDFTHKRVTPKLGSEIEGIQLSQLNDKAKDELALLVAQRGIAIFRDQDFATKGLDFVVDFTKHYGPLHIHPTSGVPKGYPEILVTYRRSDPDEYKRLFGNRTNAVGWHSDVSYELQPPGPTFFTVLEGPESGGDTIFADVKEAYRRLSPALQKRLEGLHVLHTSVDQAKGSRQFGGVERRQPVSNIHPLIRVHPVTKEKFIYVNKGFARRIVELKEQESQALLDFLYQHIEQSHDLQLRATWKPDTVIVWDNRVVLHSAIVDWDTSVKRHAVRITPQAERPISNIEDLNVPDLNLGDVEEALHKALN